MRNLPTVLSSLALLGVLILFGMRLNAPKQTSARLTQNTDGKAKNLPFAGRIAYVDIDSFEAKYEILKVKREAFEKKQRAIEDELVRAEKQLQNEATAFQKKVQGGGITQTEGEATQKRLMQMGQNLEQKKQNYSQQLLKEQGTFNEELRLGLKSFLEEYNADKGYDYILSYAEGNSILLATDALNITKDVIVGMNKRTKETSAASTSEADTSTSN